MDYATILPLVENDASSDTLGRGYSCGVSNVGLVDFDSNSDGDSVSDGSVSVEEVYYGTSHSRNGVLCQLSVQTPATTGMMCCTLQTPEPLVTINQAISVKEYFMNLIESI